jgi:hypothetical protein
MNRGELTAGIGQTGLKPTQVISQDPVDDCPVIQLFQDQPYIRQPHTHST